MDQQPAAILGKADGNDAGVDSEANEKRESAGEVDGFPPGRYRLDGARADQLAAGVLEGGARTRQGEKVRFETT